MSSSRRLSLAAATVACLIAASGASADPLNTFSAVVAPSHVKPSSSGSYTISLTSDPSSPDRAQRATIGIPSGFTVDGASVQATTTAVAGSCDASTWEADGAIIADQKIQLRRPGAQTNALCPGARLTVSFLALSAAADGTYSWTSALLNDSGAFTLSGSQPSLVVDGAAPTTAITGKPSQPSNDSGPSFAFSAGEPSTFECKLDGAVFAACSSPQTYAGLPDGSHTFMVKATDTAGNAGVPSSYTWTIDTAAPSAAISSKPSDPTKAAAASFVFTANESGSSFSCRIDGGPFESCASPKEYTGLGDGRHSFEVKATDPAGNTGAADAYAWTIDTVPPTASITSNPTNPTRESSPSFSFSANEGGSSFSCSLDGGPFAACISVKSYPPLGDGQHTFAVRATDAAGNTGGEARYAWRIDTAAPTATIGQKPNDPSNVKDPRFGFTASEAGSSFSCRLDGAAFEPCTAPKSYTGLVDGSHTFAVKATDAAGNSSAEATFTWTIDTVAPTVTISEQPSNPSNDTTPTFSFRASENGSTLACKLDTGAVAVCTSPTTYPVLAEGPHRFAVAARDAAGNTGPEAVHTWRIDTAAPTATITQKPSDPSNLEDPSFGFTASETGSRFSCRLDGGAFETCTAPKSYTGLPDGAHTFVVKAIDTAGNSSAEASFTWTIDTVAPTTMITTKPSNPSNSSSPSFSFAGSENGVRFLCRLDTEALSACTSPKAYASLAQGPHTFRVKALDPAGNASEEATHTWTIDTAAPSATITTKPSNPSNSSAASFAFTASESGSAFSCRLDGEQFAACGSPKNYTGLADGSHTLAVRATDPAGNTGPADSYTWTIDTTSPTTTITDKPNDQTNETSTSFSFSANEAGSSFACRIDNGAFSTCASPKTYVLADGRHTFQVKATDAVGNAGPATSYSWTIDTVAPSVQITQKPNSPSNEQSPAFRFSSSEAGTFSCRLEQGGFAPCTSPKSYGPLTDGQHAFAVRATDLAGNTGAAATHTWTIDTAAPTASITAKPSNPSNSRSPSFSFTANEEASTFACRLDGGAFAACTTPAGYADLDDGPHTFAVKASDPAGNTGPETTYVWTIETRGPTAALTSTPSALSNSSAATFTFAADEPASFDCNLDGRGFEACSSPAAYHGLGDGAHTFSVRAKDAVGNFSAPVGHSWAIDTTAPETTLTTAPSSGTATTATFAFAASETATFECRIDGAPFTLCGSPKSYASLSHADHQFQVRAVDAAGNADATPAVHAWKITAPAAKQVASALLSPKAGARVTRAPLLVWRRVQGARYYNVQIFRGSRKVFSAWPTKTRLKLRARWKYLGRQERLVPGRYRWYVWPGYGAPRRYGALLGQSTFVVGRAARR